MENETNAGLDGPKIRHLALNIGGTIPNPVTSPEEFVETWFEITQVVIEALMIQQTGLASLLSFAVGVARCPRVVDDGELLALAQSLSTATLNKAGAAAGGAA